MATRMLQRRGTASQWTSANAVLAAGELGVETDTGQFKIGDGTTAWTSLPYFKDTLDLDIAGKAPLASPTFTGNVTLPSTTTIGTVSAAEIAVLDGITASTTELNYTDGVTSAIQTQLDAKANSAGPTFTGTVVLPSTTSIGNVTSTEIGYVDGVTSAIQTQLDAKLSLSGGTMTGALTLSGTPSSDLHAATKSYVDNVVSGLNFHNPVLAATTANITLSGTQTVDGVALVAGDRVLVKDQTNQTQNGIYVVASLGWTRATDADNTPSGELAGGDFVFVLNGTVNAGFGYVCSNTSAITIGSTNITYVPFNAGQTITAGTGLTETTPGTLAVDSAVVQYRVTNVSDTEIGYLDGVTSAIQTQLNAKAATAGPTFTGTVVLPSTTSIGNVSDVEIGYLDGVTSAIQTQLNARAPLASPTFTGTVTLPNSTVTTAMVADLNVTTGKIADSAVTDAKVATGIAQSKITNLVTDLAGKFPSLVTLNQQTSSYTLVLADRDRMVEISNAGATTLSIPTDASVAFPVGTRIEILQTGAGQVTVAAVTPGTTTVNGTPGLKLRAQWSSAMLIKRAANTWVLIGDLVA